MHLTHLVTVPIVVLVPDRHPLADRSTVDLADLADEQFIDFPVGFGNRRIVDDAFARLGLERSVAVEVTDVTHAAAYVRQGLGVSLVPRLPENHADRSVRAVMISRPELAWVLSIGVSSTRTTSAAAQALLDLVPAYTQAVPRSM